MELGKEVLYLSQADVKKTDVSMAMTVDLVEEVFREKGLGNVEMPAKIGLYPNATSYLHAMPCWIKSHNIMGIKWVTGYNNNRRDYGLPLINGLFVYNDPNTGVPLAIMDSAWITAQRTGASAGMAIRVLGNDDDKVAMLIGCGVQGKTSLEAVMVARPNLEKFYLNDIYPEAAQKLIDEFQPIYPNCEFINTTEPLKVIPEVDDFVTCGPYDASVDFSFIPNELVKPSATICGIDFDIFFMADFMDKCVSKYYTDDIGQYNHFDSLGEIRPRKSFPVELGDAMVGKYPLREKHDEICFAMNIGMAMDDLILAEEIYKRALANNIGTILPL